MCSDTSVSEVCLTEFDFLKDNEYYKKKIHVRIVNWKKIYDKYENTNETEDYIFNDAVISYPSNGSNVRKQTNVFFKKRNLMYSCYSSKTRKSFSSRNTSILKGSALNISISCFPKKNGNNHQNRKKSKRKKLIQKSQQLNLDEEQLQKESKNCDINIYKGRLRNAKLNDKGAIEFTKDNKHGENFEMSDRQTLETIRQHENECKHFSINIYTECLQISNIVSKDVIESTKDNKNREISGGSNGHTLETIRQPEKENKNSSYNICEEGLQSSNISSKSGIESTKNGKNEEISRVSKEQTLGSAAYHNFKTFNLLKPSKRIAECVNKLYLKHTDSTKSDNSKNVKKISTTSAPLIETDTKHIEGTELNNSKNVKKFPTTSTALISADVKHVKGIESGNFKHIKQIPITSTCLIRNDNHSKPTMETELCNNKNTKKNSKVCSKLNDCINKLHNKASVQSRSIMKSTPTDKCDLNKDIVKQGGKRKPVKKNGNAIISIIEKLHTKKSTLTVYKTTKDDFAFAIKASTEAFSVEHQNYLKTWPDSCNNTELCNNIGRDRIIEKYDTNTLHENKNNTKITNVEMVTNSAEEKVEIDKENDADYEAFRLACKSITNSKDYKIDFKKFLKIKGELEQHFCADFEKINEEIELGRRKANKDVLQFFQLYCAYKQIQDRIGYVKPKNQTPISPNSNKENKKSIIGSYYYEKETAKHNYDNNLKQILGKNQDTLLPKQFNSSLGEPVSFENQKGKKINPENKKNMSTEESKNVEKRNGYLEYVLKEYKKSLLERNSETISNSKINEDEEKVKHKLSSEHTKTDAKRRNYKNTSEDYNYNRKNTRLKSKDEHIPLRKSYNNCKTQHVRDDAYNDRNNLNNEKKIKNTKDPLIPVSIVNDIATKLKKDGKNSSVGAKDIHQTVTNSKCVKDSPEKTDTVKRMSLVQEKDNKMKESTHAYIELASKGNSSPSEDIIVIDDSDDSDAENSSTSKDTIIIDDSDADDSRNSLEYKKRLLLTQLKMSKTEVEKACKTSLEKLLEIKDFLEVELQSTLKEKMWNELEQRHFNPNLTNEEFLNLRQAILEETRKLKKSAAKEEVLIYSAYVILLLRCKVLRKKRRAEDPIDSGSSSKRQKL